MRRFLSLAVSIGALLVALTVVGLYYVERPTVFRVAVAKGGESQKLLVALNQEFVRDHSDVRFRIMPAADSRAAAKAMEERSAELAVVRSDANMPPNASTALILEHQILVVMAPPGSSLTSIAELKDKRVASVALDSASEGAGALLDALEQQYALPPQTLPRKSIDITELAGLLARNEVDAVLAFGRFDSPHMVQVVRTLSREGAPSFLAIGDAAAMAKKNRGVEATTLLRGAFGGAPSLPAENIETIGDTLRLVADNDLANSVVGELVRQMLAHRTAAAAKSPVANAMETPDTDKGEALPTHPGAAAFIDNEEESFFERYSDVIYIGAMVASLLASVGATLISRVTVKGYEQFDLLLERSLEILKNAREAEDLDALRLLELQIDEILTHTLASGSIPKLDGHQLAGLTLAVEQARLAIKDRRRIVMDAVVRA
ncbi:C4-dicarboxylate ABC transporter substrate-binding protein [Rhodoblastus acidophilus]|uniref:C4-dicarboxylate ABC transporter substrate-binding protein n=1 Tax=Rhodoblastus acidophilus TaxID=1074 RepID=A0A6N8DKY5_RHOAC|nr:TAXI family TRAP transporter solute-binding subunit [Rhodoblastus acidophilus]MCW2273293.1 TRAP-type uncharacterized transport system substrate-binding protein [Rhodoblastus acidophilus]MTV30185.1 C4-dicarboxylate ABC transporter substrate-binding protein [Rhodoblastus acidophilus]